MVPNSPSIFGVYVCTDGPLAIMAYDDFNDNISLMHPSNHPKNLPDFPSQVF